MPRTTSRGKRGFIWLPREKPLTHDIKINSISVKTRNLGADFTKGLCPEVGSFKIRLINADETYTDRFSLGQTVQMYVDFASGTTKRFEGTIDKLNNVYDRNMGFILEVGGVHLTKDLLDKTVTASYSGTHTFTEIIDALNSDYLTGYTTDITATSTEKPTVNWDKKPLWDCIFDLTKLADADARVTDSKVIEFFDKNSLENKTDAIVWNQTLIDIKGLGQQIMTLKNKIEIIGDDGTGLPVLYTANDLASQGIYGTKELPIFDSKITDYTQAQELGDAEKERQSTIDDEGEVQSLLLPSLNIGEKIWITDPPLKIQGQFRVYKLTHKLPSERTIVVVGKERRLPQIFKKRIENELASQTITNPFKMIRSWNFKFDNFSELATWDSNVNISEGKIKLNSGSQGVFTSKPNVQASDVTEIHFLVVGSDVVGTTFQLSTDGGTTNEVITPNERKTIKYPGKNLVLRTTIQSATTEIDSLAILFK